MHYKLKYYIPVIGWLPNYKISNLIPDLISASTIATLLIPQALSYANELVDIPPIYGLYTCFTPIIIYSLFGTSRQLSIGPEALVAILVGTAIKSQGDHLDVVDKIGIATLLGLMVGVFTFLLGFFRLGFIDSVLSR